MRKIRKIESNMPSRSENRLYLGGKMSLYPTNDLGQISLRTVGGDASRVTIIFVKIV